MVVWKPRAFSRRCVGLALLSLPAFLVGCHQQRTSRVAVQAEPLSLVPAQQSPQYRAAACLFARHDYRAALAGVDALLHQPQYQERPADLDFLRRQEAICLRAVDPHATPPRLAASAPALASLPMPRPISQSDCGPRALLLICPRFGVHTTLDALRRQAGTKGW